MSVFVIAEAGVNHNGDEALALDLVDAAADAGADAVKFQTFRADALAVADAPKAAYQEETTDAAESQRAMLRRLELAPDAHRALRDRARAKGLRFLSSPFDVPSLRFLTDELALDTLKIPSGELTNGPLLLEAGSRGRRIILSTGMASLDEVADALGVLAFGMTRQDEKPSRQAFADALADDDGKAALEATVTLLHCTTAYPAPAEDANLRAMETLRDAFGLPVGLSDHTEGIAVAVAAAALGAAVIEKHFTMDQTLPGPDHKASLEPGALAQMIAGIRTVERAMGDGVKAPRPSEAANIPVARKSLVALEPVKAGDAFTEANLGAKRPGTGLSPMEYWDWLGREAARDFGADEAIGD